MRVGSEMPPSQTDWITDTKDLFGMLLSLLGLASPLSRKKRIFHWLLRISLITTGFAMSSTYLVCFALEYTKRSSADEITILHQFQLFRGVIWTVRAPILILVVFCKNTDITDVLRSLEQLSLEFVDYKVAVKSIKRKAYIPVISAFICLVLVDAAGWAHPYYNIEYFHMVSDMHGKGVVMVHWLHFVMWELSVMVPFFYTTLIQMLFVLYGYLLEYSIDCFHKAVEATDEKALANKISCLIRFHGRLVNFSRSIKGHVGSFIAVAFLCDASVMLGRMAGAHILSGKPDFGFLYTTLAAAGVLTVSLLPYIRVHHKEELLQEKLCDLLEYAEQEMGSQLAAKQCRSLVYISQNRKIAMRVPGISYITSNLLIKTFTLIITVSIVVPGFLPQPSVPCMLPEHVLKGMEALIYNSSSYR